MNRALGSLVACLAALHVAYAAPTVTVTLASVDGKPLQVSYTIKATGGDAVVPIFLTPFAETDDTIALPRSDSPLLVKAVSSASIGVSSMGHWAGMLTKRVAISALTEEDDLMLTLKKDEEKSTIVDLAVAYRFYASTAYSVAVNPELAGLSVADRPSYLAGGGSGQEASKWPTAITVSDPIKITVPGTVAVIKPSLDLGNKETLLAQASIDADGVDPGDDSVDSSSSTAVVRFRGSQKQKQQTLDPYTRFSSAAAGSTVSADATPSFDATSCPSQNKKDIVLAAFKHAKTMAAKAVKDSNPTGGRDAHFRLWFGTHGSGSDADLTSHEAVLANYEAIYRAIRPAKGTTSDVKFYCSSAKCKASTYAFVYGGDPYKVYLCPQFWKASKALYKADSQPGTIIHELSHFDILAGTDDNVYGKTKAKALAVSDAVKARDNADNHEYFAENQK